MTETEMPFMQTVEVRSVIPPVTHPYFLLAYWGHGGWWKIHPACYETKDCESIKQAAAELMNKGWSHITVCQLPDLT